MFVVQWWSWSTVYLIHSLTPALWECEHSCSPLRKCGDVECATGCLFSNLHLNQTVVLLLAYDQSMVQCTFLFSIYSAEYCLNGAFVQPCFSSGNTLFTVSLHCRDKNVQWNSSCHLLSLCFISKVFLLPILCIQNVLFGFARAKAYFNKLFV